LQIDLGLLIAVLVAVVAMTRSVRAETIDRVLAVVAGQIITLSDVTAARDLRLETTDGAADPTRAVLSKLIDRELILAEVDRYAPPEPTTEAVDREVARVRARFASAEALDAALARSGIDEQHLRETLRQTLRIRAYMEQRFTGTDERRQALVNDWIAGLRRRGDVIDLYLPGR
jgi:parvulin-like peptidyl-prolyl isomerase